VTAIFVTGFLLPSIIGLIVYASLTAKGAGVVPLREGASLTFYLGLANLIPYSILALLCHISLRGLGDSGFVERTMRWHMCWGAFIGLTLVSSFLVWLLLMDVDQVYWLWFPPILITFVMGLATGAALGAAAGYFVSLATVKFRKSQGPAGR